MQGATKQRTKVVVHVSPAAKSRIRKHVSKDGNRRTTTWTDENAEVLPRQSGLLLTLKTSPQSIRELLSESLALGGLPCSSPEECAFSSISRHKNPTYIARHGSLTALPVLQSCVGEECGRYAGAPRGVAGAVSFPCRGPADGCGAPLCAEPLPLPAADQPTHRGAIHHPTQRAAGLL